MYRNYSLDIVVRALSAWYVCAAIMLAVGSSAHAQGVASDLLLLKRIYSLDNLANLDSMASLGISPTDIATQENDAALSGLTPIFHEFKVEVPSNLLPLMNGMMSGTKGRLRDKYPQVRLEGRLQIDRLCIGQNKFFEEFPGVKFVRSDPLPEPFDPNFNRPRASVRFSTVEKRQYGPAFNEFNLAGFMVEFKNRCLSEFSFSQDSKRM